MLNTAYRIRTTNFGSLGFSSFGFRRVLLSFVATIVGCFFAVQTASAAVFGMSLGHRFEPSRIAIDFLFPLKHDSGHRPRGGVIQTGLHILGGDGGRDGIYSMNWIGLAIPIAYEHVFSSGISIITGAEFLYYESKRTHYAASIISVTDITRDSELGGGIVIGTNYYFKSGVFFGFRTSVGIAASETTYESGGKYNGIAGYVDPTISVGYMF